MKTNITLPLAALAALGLLLTLGNVACHRTPPESNASSPAPKPLYYTCPMHPDVREDQPGSCHICGMNLTPVYPPDNATNRTPATPKP